MKNTLKRIMSVLLMTALVFTCMTACGAGAEDSSSQTENAGTEASKEDSSGNTAGEGDDADKAGGEDDGESGGNLSGLHHAEIEVKDYGTIKVELDADTAPISVTNFVKLAKEGFYDGLTFHRIISGFMIQGGDPNGDGTGGSDTPIKGEFSVNGVENNISHERGVLSMARTGNDYNSGSSQFFIMHQDTPSLDGQYAAFGRVTEGIEIVDKICEDTPVVDNNGTVEKANQPVITKITVTD